MRHLARMRPGGSALVAAALFLATGAVGYWTAPGSGTASATLDNPLALTMSPGTPATQMSPGTSASVAASVSNPNPYAVQISSITLDNAQGSGGLAVDAGHSGCGLSVLSFTTQTNSGAGWTVPAKVGVTPGSLTISMSSALAMATSAANACQGATFTVYLAATV